MNIRKMLAISIAGGIAIAIFLAVVAWFALDGDKHGVIAGALAGLGLIIFIFFGLLITRDNNR